jgi:hypothetical protein
MVSRSRVPRLTDIVEAIERIHGVTSFSQGDTKRAVLSSKTEN